MRTRDVEDATRARTRTEHAPSLSPRARCFGTLAQNRDDVEGGNLPAGGPLWSPYPGRMTAPSIGALQTVPALDRPDLLAAPVHAALTGLDLVHEIGVVEIDPDLADTAALSEAYGLPLHSGANCVVVSGRRAGDERLAACVVRADTRADVNNAVKRLLDVRKCSFHPLERAVEETGMEYGGITPIGLPASWRLLVDDAVLDIDVAVIGSGVRRSKLLLPGRVLAHLPGAEVATIRQ